MEWLRSQNAPLVIAALLSVLGWHIGTLTEDIRDTRSVVYRVEDEGKGGSISAVITNVSKSQMLEGASFALVCVELEPCLDFESSAVVLHPPTATDTISPQGADALVGLNVDLAAGGRIGLSVKRRTSQKVDFLFFPKGLPIEDEAEADAVAVASEDAAEERGDADSRDVYVLDGSTLRGWVVLNYFNIVLASFFIVLIGSVLGAMRLGVKKKARTSRVPKNKLADTAKATPGGGEGA